MHRLLGIGDYDSLLSNPILGKSWEGFVAENLHSVMLPLAQTYFFRTASGTEIDFVIKMPNSEIWAIEIKFGVHQKLARVLARPVITLELHGNLLSMVEMKSFL